MWKLFKYLLYIGVGFYLLACGILYANQEQLLFLNDALPDSYSFSADEEVEIEVEENIFLHGLHLNKKGKRGIILYFHGNKGNVRRCYRQAQHLAKSGYQVFMPDYRSYGKSDGHIESEAQFFADLEKVYLYLTKKYKESDILLAGYSIGSGAAAYLAAKYKPKGLVLLAPYTSITDLKDTKFPFIPSFLVKYPFDTASRISSISCPIYIFHGTEDKIIPVTMGAALKALNPSANFITTPSSHRGIIFQDIVVKSISNHF